MYGAKVLLGTATPSVETYFNATNGKYGLVEMKERYQDLRLPHIEQVDIKELAHQNLNLKPPPSCRLRLWCSRQIRRWPAASVSPVRGSGH